MALFDANLDVDDELDDAPSVSLTGDDVNRVSDALDALQADADPGTPRSDVRHAHLLGAVDRQTTAASAAASNADSRSRELRGAVDRNTAAVERTNHVPLRAALHAPKRARAFRGNPL